MFWQQPFLKLIVFYALLCMTIVKCVLFGRVDDGGWFWMTKYVQRFGVFYKNGERYGVLSDCEELWSRQIVETLIFEVAIMHKRD